MKNTQKKWLGLSLILTLIAIGFHFYLAQKYFALKFGMSLGSSSCNINSYLNCDAVTASQYSSFLGRPMALWGLVANALFLIAQLSVFLGWFSQVRRGEIFTFIFSCFIAGASLVMGFISLTQLSKVCLYCAGTYLASWISFVILFMIISPKKSEIADFFKTLFTHGKAAIGFAIAIPFFAWILNTAMLEQVGVNQNLEPMIQERITAWKAAPMQNFDLKTGLRIGKENSPIVIVEFADFRCPHCKMAYPTLHAFSEAHADVQFIFKIFPLDGTCNPDPTFNGQGDGISCRLAMGVICSENNLKKGWDLHHFIFDEQGEFHSLDQVDEKLCNYLNTDCATFKQCMNSTETLNELKTMAQEAMAAKITGTPTIFLNGKNLQGAQLLPILESAYSQAHEVK